MLSLAEIHGSTVHLPLLGVTVFAALAVFRWRGVGGELVERTEPWVFGAVADLAAVAFAFGLTVLVQAGTKLRGASQRSVSVPSGAGTACVLPLALSWQRVRHAAVPAACLAVGTARI